MLHYRFVNGQWIECTERIAAEEAKEAMILKIMTGGSKDENKV